MRTAVGYDKHQMMKKMIGASSLAMPNPLFVSSASSFSSSDPLEAKQPKREEKKREKKNKRDQQQEEVLLLLLLWVGKKI